MWRGVLGTLSLWAVGAVALRATVIAPQACPAVSSEAAIAGARAAAAWAGHVQLADGSYLYEYNAEDDHDLGGYNVVRHAGVTMAVFQYAGTTGDLSVLPTADRGLDWMTASMLRRDGWAQCRTS